MTDQTTDQTTQTSDSTTQTADPTFIETLGNDFKGNDAFKDITDVKGLAQKYLDQTKSLSDLQASLPKAPESPDAYTDITAPDGVNLNDEAIKEFKTLAHELGLTDESFGKIVGYQLGMIQKTNQSIINQNAETMDSLKKELGDKFDESFDAANKILTAVPELQELMGEQDPSGESYILRTSPKWFKAMAALGKAIQVDRLPNTSRNANSGRPKGIDGAPRLSYPSMEK